MPLYLLDDQATVAANFGETFPKGNEEPKSTAVAVLQNTRLPCKSALWLLAGTENAAPDNDEIEIR